MAIFRKSSKDKQKLASSPPQPEDAPQIKYPKPKILLMDLPQAAHVALSLRGFNVSNGTLGKPYKVAKTSNYQPLIGSGDVPKHTEQEIVVIDLNCDELDEGPQGEKHRPDAEFDLWGKCDRGFIDPRVRTSIQLKDAFDRTHSIGGVFVVFADERTGISLQVARCGYNGLYDGEQFPHDVYHFLSEISDLVVENDHGEELIPADTKSSLGRLLADFLPESAFKCVLKGGYRSKDTWQTLAKNKFGQAVAICRCRSAEGSVIILPQIRDKVAFLERLFIEVLPELAPHLFPHIEKGKWTHQPEYELPRVKELKAKQDDIVRNAKEVLKQLDAEIEKERTANGWIQNLLTGTDSDLVAAVKKAFEAFGFAEVVDVDVERDREGKSRREDLQIHDQSPLIIVDIKGIGAFPSDEDALQADKHAAIRMREMKRTDIVGLSIINHQRHLPPLDRDNVMPFRQELLDAAEERSLGLMTSWDVYRLLRNSTKFGWNGEQIRPLFYKRGRITAVPTHYRLIGTVAKAWTDKFGVVIENQEELRIGDRVAVEFPIEFEEVAVSSIRVNDQDVQCAKVGDPVGILWSAEMPKLKEGMRVFRVSADVRA
jgi:hypothetical protein